MIVDGLDSHLGIVAGSQNEERFLATPFEAQGKQADRSVGTTCRAPTKKNEA